MMGHTLINNGLYRKYNTRTESNFGVVTLTPISFLVCAVIFFRKHKEMLCTLL